MKYILNHVSKILKVSELNENDETYIESLKTICDGDDESTNKIEYINTKYEELYNYSITKINNSVSSTSKVQKFIGILDYQGLNNKNDNDLTKCINSNVNSLIHDIKYKKEQELYQLESIKWKVIDFKTKNTEDVNFKILNFYKINEIVNSTKLNLIISLKKFSTLLISSSTFSSLLIVEIFSTLNFSALSLATFGK